MQKIKLFWSKMSGIATFASLRKLLILLFIIIVGFSLIRACSKIGIPVNSAYRIARDGSWYPLPLMGKEKNMLGFSDELIAAIAKEEKIRVELLLTGTNHLFDGLDEGEYDAVLSYTTPNVVNKEKYLFSDPFYLVGPVLMVPKSSQVKSLEDMANKIVGIKSGSSMVYNVIQFPSIMIVSYDNVGTSLDDLVNNKIDGLIMDAMPAYVYTQRFYPNQLKIISSPLNQEGLRLITRHGLREQALVEKFNEGLKVIRENGTYNELIIKWQLINPQL